MSDKIREDSIAEKLEDTRWDYSQRDDRNFLLEPIGAIFGTFCWDGKPERLVVIRRDSDTREGDR